MNGALPSTTAAPARYEADAGRMVLGARRHRVGAACLLGRARSWLVDCPLCSRVSASHAARRATVVLMLMLN